MLTRLARLALLLVLGLACQGQTRIVATVQSDLSVPTELDAIQLDVAGPTDRTSQNFPLAATTEPGKLKLPLEIELVPLAAADASFTIEVTGLVTTAAIVSQTARVSFVPGEALRLELSLYRSCIGVTCPADYTCAGQGCDRPIASGKLPHYESHPVSTAAIGTKG